MTNTHTNTAIGTDIVEVGRLHAAVKRFGDVFLSKIFTEDELAYCFGLSMSYCSLAVRFAAKEAFSKALGIGIGIGSPMKWNDVSVQNHSSGAPEIALSAKAKDLMKRCGFKFAKVSLSHTKTLAQAVVILTN
ncbi:MAG: holo-ACP synthase [Puniceicoccales bacterium]|jgi:holo-[acyl-carrier protein] synthase|nr:holo-ACP synthase [Puniceicoccales bacterium]